MNWDVPDEKVRDYLLNFAHPVDGPKARYFQGCGFSRFTWHILADALRRHPEDNPVAATQYTPFGSKLIVRCQLHTPDRRNPCIRTIWTVEPGGVPQLVTAYPSEA